MAGLTRDRELTSREVATGWRLRGGGGGDETPATAQRQRCPPATGYDAAAAAQSAGELDEPRCTIASSRSSGHRPRAHRRSSRRAGTALTRSRCRTPTFAASLCSPTPAPTGRGPPCAAGSIRARRSSATRSRRCSPSCASCLTPPPARTRSSRSTSAAPAGDGTFYVVQVRELTEHRLITSGHTWVTGENDRRRFGRARRRRRHRRSTDRQHRAARPPRLWPPPPGWLPLGAQDDARSNVPLELRYRTAPAWGSQSVT